jgi:hypothetical protein
LWARTGSTESNGPTPEFQSSLHRQLAFLQGPCPKVCHPFHSCGAASLRVANQRVDMHLAMCRMPHLFVTLALHVAAWRTRIVRYNLIPSHVNGILQTHAWYAGCRMLSCDTAVLGTTFHTHHSIAAAATTATQEVARDARMDGCSRESPALRVVDRSFLVNTHEWSWMGFTGRWCVWFLLRC